MRALLVIALAGCHQLDRTLELEKHRHTEEGMHSLEKIEIERARTLYQRVLDQEPEHAVASAGWAFAELLLIGDSKPARTFIDHCNQPYFDIARSVLGPAGLLEKQDRAALGTAQLETRYRPDESGDDAIIPFSNPAVRTEVEVEVEDDPTEHQLVVRVRDEASERTLQLAVNVGDVFADDGVETPLVPGLEVPLADIDGELSVFEASSGSPQESTVPVGGRVRFELVGEEEGDPIAIEIIEAQIPGYCLALPCTARWRIEGRIEDEVSRIEIPEDEYPFGPIDADVGPPFAQEFVVALERCAPIHDDFLAERMRELGDVFELLAQRFGAAGRNDDFSYSLPQEMLHLDRDLPINAADASALEAASYAAAAIAELASRYRWFSGHLQRFVAEFDRGGSLVRDLEPNRTAMDLQQVLLVPRPDFDLSRVRDRLSRGLTAIVRALTLEVTREGLFDFRNLEVRKLSDDAADFARTLLESLTSDVPLSPQSTPLYRLHLRRLIDAPLDNTNAAARLGVSNLIYANPDPYQLELAPELTTRWFELLDVVELPPDRPEDSCTVPSECEDTGYGCDTEKGYCVPETPFLFSERALDALIDEANGNWPRTVNPLMREIIELLGL